MESKNLEKNIGMQKRLRNVIGVIIALFCLGYPLYSLSEGFFKWQFQTTDYKMMLLELLVWFLIAMLGIKRANILWLIVELTIFTYLHMMFLPVIVAIIYALLTEKIGNTIYKFYIKKEEKNKNIISYFMGVMVLTILYAILSFFNLGSIKNLIRLNVVFLIILCANALRKHRFMRVDKRKMKVSRSEYL